MEKKKLHLDAPFLSVRQIPTKPENPNESENIKKKKTTSRKVKDSFQESDHETLVRLLQDDQSFGRVMKPSSIPFLCEQTHRKPKDHHHMATTLIEESDLIKALDMVSSTTSFGVSEFEKNGERLRNVSRDDVILEHHDLIKKKKKKKQNIALQRVSMALNQDLRNVSDDYDHHNHVTKKALFGLCSKNSLDVLNPVLSRVKTCQNLGVKPEKSVNPKSLDSANKTESLASLPRILRSNRIMSKSQELYLKPRFSTDITRIPRNISRLQRTTSKDQIQRQDMRFLVEEVKRRRDINKIRSVTSQISVSQPPLPKTPSESWLCRTLPRSLATSVVSGQAAGFKKMIDEKNNPQSIKWKTIVKTSYKHHDHVYYSKELNVVHPSR